MSGDGMRAPSCDRSQWALWRGVSRREYGQQTAPERFDHSEMPFREQCSVPRRRHAPKHHLFHPLLPLTPSAPASIASETEWKRTNTHFASTTATGCWGMAASWMCALLG